MAAAGIVSHPTEQYDKYGIHAFLLSEWHWMHWTHSNLSDFIAASDIRGSIFGRSLGYASDDLAAQQGKRENSKRCKL